MSKFKKRLKKLNQGLQPLDGYEGIVSGAAKPALWAGYASAYSAVASIAKEGKSSKKTKKRRKKAIKAIEKLVKQAGGKKALRPTKFATKSKKSKVKIVDAAAQKADGSHLEMEAQTAAETQVDDQTAMARLIGTPDDASNVVPLNKGRGDIESNIAAPGALKEPLDGSGDDLQLIVGVGPKLEEALHGLGIWHYEQIAAWGPEEIAWVDEHLRFSGRIEREQWVAQAGALSRGGRDEHVRVFGKEPR